MGFITVDNLKNGMKLAGDLKNTRGRFLLSQGTVLEEKHIRIIKTWGVTEVDIEGIDQESIVTETLAQIDPGILQKINSHINFRFNYYGKQPDSDVIKEIKRISILKLSEKISQGMELDKLIELHGIYVDEDLESDSYIDTDIINETVTGEKLVSSEMMVKREIKFFSFPDVYFKIVKALKSPKSSSTYVAEVLSKDPGLASKLLKLVNSAFYGIPGTIDSIKRAITLIGYKELSTLALGISVMRYFKNMPPGLIDVEAFWKHSIACGIYARIFASYKSTLSEERFFLAGIIHDIGRLILVKEFPKTMKLAIIKSRRKGIPLYKIERKIFGYDHAGIASLILKKWNIPLSLEKIIRYHHNPLSTNAMEASILHTANQMAIAFEYESSGETFIQAMEKKVWEKIGLPTSVLGTAVKQAEKQISETVRIFCGTIETDEAKGRE
ncbi:MAG: HDOD domain-containing protein [bacterium]|nr:HDOD domain-containing protein [bacterium]